jgi:hypothetical protein
VPRKRQPNDLIDAFKQDLLNSISDWTQICGQLGFSGALAKRVSVDTFVRAAVAFEGFRSDWHIAAIARDSSALAAHLTTRARNAVGQNPVLATLISVDLPKHPTLTQVADLLDPQHKNISLSSAQAWRKRASEHLVDPYRTKVDTIPAADTKLMDAVIALRDFIAHESDNASSVANGRLRNMSAATDRKLRRGTRQLHPSGIGAYLHALQPGGRRRVELFHDRLDQVAERLRI